MQSGPAHDHHRRAIRHVQQIAKEERCSTFTLSEMAHQQSRESEQSWTELAGWNAGEQLEAVRCCTTGACQSTSLILHNDRCDCRQFPDLMSKGSGVGSCQFFATRLAVFRKQGMNFCTTFDGNQFANDTSMPFLSASPLLGFRLRSRPSKGG